MAFTFSKTTPATGAAAMYDFKQQLKVGSSWTVQSSSDGTTYNAGGDQITGGGAGANGFANNNAWVRLRSPAGAGGAEFIIQRGTSNPSWRMKYSMTAGFTGGSPSATQVPSATDEVIIWGGGSDASPTFGSLFGTDGTYRWNVGSDGASPYGFWGGAFPTGGGTPNAGIVYDPLTQTTAGDGHLYAIYVSASPFQGTTISTESMSPTANQLWSSVPAASPVAADWTNFCGMYLSVAVSTAVAPNGLPTNPLTTKDEVLPIVIARRGALSTPGYKGVLSLMKWTGLTRTTGDTLTVSGTRDRIIYKDVSLPWDGSVPSV